MRGQQVLHDLFDVNVGAVVSPAPPLDPLTGPCVVVASLVQP